MPSSGPSLGRRVFVGEIQFLGVMSAILVLSAWSFLYWAGWAFVINFAVCMFALTTYLAYRDPALLERRMRAGPAAEREPAQKLIQTFNASGSVALLILPGLDNRFAWSHVPMVGMAAGHLMIVACFAVWFYVFRENPFASSIVEIGVNQRVIDSGPYAIVRHPMYSAALPLFVGTALALGSFWGLLPALLLSAGLVARLLHEERYLISNLPGYDLYRSRVRWRLVPGVW